MHGFLIVDKPAGITSHDVVARVRRLTGTRQVGHTGTLDPFATGVLVVACGAATKLIPYLEEDYKAYQAHLRLGETTDTQDRTGKVLISRPALAVEGTTFRQAASSFVGHISQIPPMYSAVKQGGVPLYRLARSGQEVERAPREVEIAALIVDRFSSPEAEISVVCSKGTYVRTLVHDIGEHLGCGAHVLELRRMASGSFQITEAVTLDILQDLVQRNQPLPLVDVNRALAHLPAVTVSLSATQKILNGLLPYEVCAAIGETTGIFRLLTPSQDLLALANFKVTDAAVGGRLLRVFPELCALHG